MNTAKYFNSENDTLTAAHTVFQSFRELVKAENYTPSIQIDSTTKFKLAEIYNSYMVETGDSRRANRSFAKIKAMPELKPENVQPKGFKKYLDGIHLPVIIPPMGGTITCKLPDGKQITFSFIPNDCGSLECCDIQAETGEVYVKIYSGNKTVFNSQNIGEVTLTTIHFRNE